MNYKKLSVLIPVYNEEKTIEEVIKIVKKTDIGKLKKEIVVVDDGSTDDSLKILKKIKGIKLVIHKKNSGKGAGIRTAIKNSSGDILIIQDADMEYDPKDYKTCIKPIISGKAKVVYGSRILKKGRKRGRLDYHLGGMLVTLATNILYLTWITDEPTCYKTFNAKFIKKIRFNGNGFEWEPEITAKILKTGTKIHEVPISYNPRSIEEGKKINWKDGVKALWTLLKYRFKK